MNEYDVAIVGGGPIGCYTAAELSSRGFKVGLFEQKKEIGIPIKCAGLLTPRIFSTFTIPQESSVQNKIYGATIHSPSNHELTIGGDKVHAFAVDRTTFDQTLAHQAEKHNVDMHTSSKVISAQHDKKNISLTIKNSQKKNRNITCSLVIGADGPQSRIRQTFLASNPKERLHGIGAEIIDSNLDPKIVHIYLGTDIAPGFFAWMIPTDPKGETARLGLCASSLGNKPLHKYFSDFMVKPHVQQYLEGSTTLTSMGGLIPLGLLQQTTTDRVMIVGDAAAQVKPTSGGGIYTGLTCAKHCVAIAQQALEKSKVTNSFLQTYHKEWMKTIGKELSMGMRFRRILKNLDNDYLDKYIKKLDTPKIRDTINTYGDIDHPSTLLMPLIKQAPSLAKLLLHYK